jgi:hypothetical protein
MAGSETQRFERMLHGLVGLRRVRRLLPSNQDVERGITGLEEAIGGAVSQRIAARALGVPHPEVSKLIQTKQLTTIDTVRGKAQIEVRPLVDLMEERGAEEAAAEAAELAAELGEEPSEKSAAPVVPEGARDITQIMVMRRLAFHRALARGLDRPMVERAKEIVVEWRESGQLPDDQADEWERILDRPVSDVASAMTEYSERGDELRQNSPFNAMGRRESDRH